jgi:hypothetical protein
VNTSFTELVVAESGIFERARDEAEVGGSTAGVTGRWPCGQAGAKIVNDGIRTHIYIPPRCIQMIWL